MSYIWEEELMSNHGVPTVWQVQHHLKKVWNKDPLEKQFAIPLQGTWKVSVAWVTKIGERNWYCQFVNNNGNRKFRSLKAAKAYAVAIITLEN